jgi:hypothetical protein
MLLILIRDVVYTQSLHVRYVLQEVLVCDWLHSVGKNHFYVMILIKQGCYYIQSLHLSFVLQEDFV